MQKLALFLALGCPVLAHLFLFWGQFLQLSYPGKVSVPEANLPPCLHALSVETAMIIYTNLNRNITGEMFCTAWDQAPSDAAFSVVPSLDAAARAQLSAAQPLHSGQGPGPPALLVVAG